MAYRDVLMNTVDYTQTEHPLSFILDPLSTR